MTDDVTESATDATVRESPLSERIEAILLIIDEPIGLVALAAAVGSPVAAVRQTIETLVDDYDGKGHGPRRGFELREVGGGWRLYVREDHDDVVAEFVGGQAPARLSQAALETLAVIAYKQPVTRSQVVYPRGERRLGRAHSSRSRSHHRAVRGLRDRRDQLRHHRRAPAALGHQLARRSAADLSSSRRRRRRFRRRDHPMTSVEPARPKSSGRADTMHRFSFDEGTIR